MRKQWTHVKRPRRADSNHGWCCFSGWQWWVGPPACARGGELYYYEIILFYETFWPSVDPSKCQDVHGAVLLDNLGSILHVHSTWQVEAMSGGIFITRLTGVGGYFCLPPSQNSGTTGRIYKFQMAFDRSGKIVERNLMLFVDFGITDHVRGLVKFKMLDDLVYLVLSRTWVVKMEISQYNDMDHVWDTSRVSS